MVVEVKVLLKMVCYTCGLTTLETRYCSFSPLCCFSCMHFVLICTVVVSYCFVVCGCMSGFCNVHVCEGFVMCGWVCVCVCVCACVCACVCVYVWVL